MFDETLQPYTILGREKAVDIPVPLSVEEKMCQYQVILHYGSIGEVKSDFFGKSIVSISKWC